MYSDQHNWPPLLDLETCIGDPVVLDRVELFRYDNAGIVRLTSTAGVTGIGVTNIRINVLWPMLAELVAPAFLGKDLRGLESLINEVYTFRANYKYQGTPFWNCVAYLEAAAWDLLGNSAGKSVGHLIGGPWRTQIPVYLSSMRRDTSPEAEVEWIGRRLEETKARAVKMKIGGRMKNNLDSMPGRSEALIRHAREQWGSQITLYVDANGSYDHTEAIRIGHILEDFGYAWLEEPCPFEQHEETKAVADALEIPVAGGEQDCNLAWFRTMIRERTVDIVQPDMMYNGGLIRALRVAALAAESSIPVVPHSPKHNPELATLVHFASVVRHTAPFMEYPAVEVRHGDWYSPAFVLREGGYLDVPTGPGLGIEYDPAIWNQADRLLNLQADHR